MYVRTQSHAHHTHATHLHTLKRADQARKGEEGTAGSDDDLQGFHERPMKPLPVSVSCVPIVIIYWLCDSCCCTSLAFLLRRVLWCCRAIACICGMKEERLLCPFIVLVV